MQIKMDPLSATDSKMGVQTTVMPIPGTLPTVVLQPPQQVGTTIKTCKSQSRQRMCRLACVCVIVCVALLGLAFVSAEYIRHHFKYGSRHYHPVGVRGGHRILPRPHPIDGYQPPVVHHPGYNPESHHRFYMRDGESRVPADAYINKERKIERVSIPAVDGASQTENLHDFNTGFTALKAAGKCFIQPLDKSLWARNLAEDDDDEEKEITARHADKRIVPGIIHAAVLKFTTGDDIFDFCRGLPAQWIVDNAKEEVEKEVEDQLERVMEEVTDHIDGGDIGDKQLQQQGEVHEIDKRQTCHKFTISGCIPVIELCIEYQLRSNCANGDDDGEDY